MKPAAFLLLALPFSAAAQQSSIDPAGPFGWGQNTGWAALHYDTSKAQGGVIVGEYFLSGHAWGQNTGWINFGSGAPQDGIRYSNATAADCGVRHDGAGGLSGFAWGQNTGWINFGWAAADDPNRPRINLTTGKFHGYAWSQNTGWLNLDTGLATLRIELRDTDGDGLDDSWETLHFTGLTLADSLTDSDADGVSDADEFLYGTDPGSAPFSGIAARGFTPDGKEIRIEFPSTPARYYRIFSSVDLVSWTPESDWLQGWPSLTDLKLNATGSRRFFRLDAKRPLTP